MSFERAPFVCIAILAGRRRQRRCGQVHDNKHWTWDRIWQHCRYKPQCDLYRTTQGRFKY